MLGRGKRLAEDTWKQVIAEVDTNGDGKVTYDEFEAMMKKYMQ